jgi:glycosyltransferase involved in cell wall biosynthesis
VDAFIAPSRFLRTILVRAGFDPERVRWVRNFATAPAPTAVTPVPGRFVYAGRLSAEKGVATVIAAATRLRAGTLVVCGDGPEHERVAAAAAAAPAGRVVLRGHLNAADLHAELAAAAFAVVPSEWFENAPFAVLEAMAAGRGVVASRIGGLPELVADGETGVLVAPGDVEAWTQALATAVAAPAVTAAWGRAARARALRDHDLGEHVDRLEALYREVAS